ncbi:MAG: ABC transporter substrate-binding protein, partial [Hyphomicrobiales bacterium]
VGILPAVLIPKGTKKLDLAHKFIDVVLSSEGQKCFSEKAYIGSVNKNVTLSDKVAQIAPTGEALDKLWFIDPDLLSRNLAAWTRRWQREVTR